MYDSQNSEAILHYSNPACIPDWIILTYAYHRTDPYAAQSSVVNGAISDIADAGGAKIFAILKCVSLPF